MNKFAEHGTIKYVALICLLTGFVLACIDAELRTQYMGLATSGVAGYMAQLQPGGSKKGDDKDNL